MNQEEVKELTIPKNEQPISRQFKIKKDTRVAIEQGFLRRRFSDSDSSDD